MLQSMKQKGKLEEKILLLLCITEQQMRATYCKSRL